MKSNNTSYQVTDSSGNQFSYGADRHGSWLEFPDKRDRTAIYGNSRVNRERMRREIAVRGIRIPAKHMHLFAEPMELAA